MKKLLLLLLFIPHVSFGQVKNGEYNTYYESGELLSTVNFVDDLRQGQLKGYYESGKFLGIVNYVDGVKQ